MDLSSKSQSSLEPKRTAGKRRSVEVRQGCRSCLASTIGAICEQHVFRRAFKLALPCAFVAAGVKYLDLHAPDGKAHFLVKLGGTEIYSSCTFLIGMLLLFRTSQSYARFWDGVDAAYAVRADLFDVVSQSIAFCKTSQVQKPILLNFQHILVRLMSLLHSLILAELEAVGGIDGSEHALTFELIDAQGLDAQSLFYIHQSSQKVELVSQWITSHLVCAIDSAIIDVPAPISTRLFQELNSAHCHFHKALKIADTAFPFPYTAASQICLIVHWLVTPLVVGTWTQYIWYSAVLTFMQVFILWSLDALASELENPFEQDLNDLDVHSLHQEFNEHILMLLEPAAQHTPKVSKKSLDSARCRSSTESFAVVSARTFTREYSLPSSGDQSRVPDEVLSVSSRPSRHEAKPSFKSSIVADEMTSMSSVSSRPSRHRSRDRFRFDEAKPSLKSSEISVSGSPGRQRLRDRSRFDEAKTSPKSCAIEEYRPGTPDIEHGLPLCRSPVVRQPCTPSGHSSAHTADANSVFV